MTNRGLMALGAVALVIAFAVSQSNASAARSVDWFFDAVLVSQRPAVDIDTGDGMTITGVDASTRVDYVFTVDLLDAGADADSTTVTGDSGLQFVGGDLTLLRGCVDGDYLGWTEATDLWGCTQADASSDPLLVQNVSQAATPGTTVDGQIRLWEDSDIGPTTGGRILAQIAGTTYQWNSDSGLTFENRPARLAQDKAYFAAQIAPWQQAEVDAVAAAYEGYDAAHPEHNMPVLTPSWGPSYWIQAAIHYSSAVTVLGGLGIDTGDLPALEAFSNVQARQPWPDPDDYRVPYATVNETLSDKTKTPMAVGDIVLLVVDSVEVDSQTGDVMSFHVVPSTLADELGAILLALLDDPAVAAQVKAKLP